MKRRLSSPDAWRTAAPGEINYALVDRYTIAHYAWGVLMGAGRMPWWGALLFAVGWELAERPLKRVFPFPYGTQDSFRNAAGDAVAMMAGWASWQILPKIPEQMLAVTVTPRICLPRHHAIRVAELERDSLLLRASEGGPCRQLWLRAAAIADGAVQALREGRDHELVRQMYAIGTGWMAAARCRGWRTP